jgi:putative transposase
MARKPRAISGSGYYHFITRGVNKKKLFHQKSDFKFYLALLNEYRHRFGLKIHHYCLMNNHAHVLLRAEEMLPLSRFGHFIQRRYAYYYCKTYYWSGQVFQSRFKSIPIENDNYLLECGRYIERNPVRANLVKSLEEYPWSSYHYYVQGQQNSLIEPSPMYLHLHKQKKLRKGLYKKYVNTRRPYENLLDQMLLKS